MYVHTYANFRVSFCLSVYYGTNSDTGTVFMNELFLIDRQLRGNFLFLGRISKTFPELAGIIYRICYCE